MNEFPKMLYQLGGVEEIHGGKFSTRIVESADEEAVALEGVWFLTTDEAKEAAMPANPSPVGKPGTWGKR